MISPEKIAHAKSLHQGLRVILRGQKGQIIAPGYRVNDLGYVPIWLVRLDEQPSEGMYPCWSDEIEVVS